MRLVHEPRRRSASSASSSSPRSSPLGVIVATLLGRAGDDVGRLYFADLARRRPRLPRSPSRSSRGSSPPQVVALAALVFAAVGLARPAAAARRSSLSALRRGVAGVALRSSARRATPPRRPRRGREARRRRRLFSEWGPVFRVDVLQFSDDQPNRLLVHDGTYGSGIWSFDGDVAGLDALRRPTPGRSRSTCSARRPSAS